MNDYKKYIDLKVWKEARRLIFEVYLVTKSFPKEELYGLTSQIRRCSISVPFNIAEGCGRNHKRDSIQFFFVARGSLNESETQLFLSSTLNLLSSINLSDLLSQLKSVRKLLNGFIRYYLHSVPST